MVFSWLFVIILAYFFFSLSFLGDKLILSGPPKPRPYTFYVGVVNIFIILIIPFIDFGLPSASSVFWIAAEAAVFLSGLYVMYSALERFDVSRVMTTIGATQPVFIFVLTLAFWGGQNITLSYLAAFLLLLAGGMLISFKKSSKETGNYVKLTLIASLLFSFDYIFLKMVFMQQPFLQGFIWTRIFVFLFALLFLLNKSIRNEIFAEKIVLSRKIKFIFAGGQSAGAVAGFLQNLAISMAPAAFLPILNSLKGVQYVFLFAIALFFTIFFPTILKEEISRGIIIQKTVSIILIAAGLALLIG